MEKGWFMLHWNHLRFYRLQIIISSFSEKPHFVRRMPETTRGEFGRSIDLPCNVRGTPKPDIVWYKDGIPLSETPNLRFNHGSGGDNHTADGQSQGGLSINFLRLDDSGMFQCSASNEAGEVVGYTWLVVKSKCFSDDDDIFARPGFHPDFPRDSKLNALLAKSHLDKIHNPSVGGGTKNSVTYVLTSLTDKYSSSSRKEINSSVRSTVSRRTEYKWRETARKIVFDRPRNRDEVSFFFYF